MPPQVGWVVGEAFSTQRVRLLSGGRAINLVAHFHVLTRLPCRIFVFDFMKARKDSNDCIDVELSSLLEGGRAGYKAPAYAHSHSHGRKTTLGRARRYLLVGAGVLVVAGALQLLSYALEPTIGTFLFYVRLQGTNSQGYCPDYLPLVRRALDPYRKPVASGEELEQALQMLKIQCSPLRIRSGVVDYPTHPGNDRRRHEDLRANVQLAQSLFGRLPDLDVLFNPSDAPAMPRSRFPEPSPLPPPLSYFTTHAHRDLSIPYFRLAVWDEQSALSEVRLLSNVYPWESKHRVAVWRGSTTGQPEPHEEDYLTLPRARLVNMSLHHPELLDARFTSCKQCHGRVQELYKEQGYGYARFFSFEDLFAYTGLVDVDGNSWSSRFSQLLSVGSAVFKQETAYVEWFRPLLQPWVHYVPIREDLSDLIPVLQNYTQPGMDAALEAIATRSTEFYERLLLPSKQLCYLHLLLKEYATLAAASSTEG